MTTRPRPLRRLWRMASWPFRLVWRGYQAISAEQARKFRDLMMGLFVIFAAIAVYQNRQVLDGVTDLLTQSRERGLENQQTLREIQELADRIEQQTSPEAQQRQQQVIDSIISLVGCNNEDTIQRLVDVLVERGVLEPGLLAVITDECELILAGASTTTTLPR